MRRNPERNGVVDIRVTATGKLAFDDGSMIIGTASSRVKSDIGDFLTTALVMVDLVDLEVTIGSDDLIIASAGTQECVTRHGVPNSPTMLGNRQAVGAVVDGELKAISKVPRSMDGKRWSHKGGPKPETRSAHGGMSWTRQGAMLRRAIPFLRLSSPALHSLCLWCLQKGL